MLLIFHAVSRQLTTGSLPTQLFFFKFRYLMATGSQFRQWGESEIAKLVLCLLLLCLLGISLSSCLSWTQIHMQSPSLFLPYICTHAHTHTTVWSPSLLCHFEFLSHLFHSLIRASDDRRMRWGGVGEGRVKDKGLSIVQSRVIAKARSKNSSVINIYIYLYPNFQPCTSMSLSLLVRRCKQESIAMPAAPWLRICTVEL